MIVGFLGGMISLAMMHPNNLVVLFVTLLVSQAVGRDYTRERRRIVDKATHDFVGQIFLKLRWRNLPLRELLMVIGTGVVDGYTVLYCIVLCYVVLCCVVLCCVTYDHVLLCFVICFVMCFNLLCCYVLCCIVLY